MFRPLDEMLRAMSERRRASSSFGGPRPAPAHKPIEPPTEPEPEPTAPASTPTASPAASQAQAAEPTGPSPFLEALAELLVQRGLDVPPGLRDAPPAAYAGQGAGAVATLARLNNTDLAQRAAKVAGWQARQTLRAQQVWDSSPLIGEIRRRGLPEPARPARPAGVAFSLKRPLADWSDAELREAAEEWARLGS